MSNRFISGTRVLGMALGFSLAALPVAGQVMNTAAKSDLPPTPDGHPDLQGTYDLSTMTPLERWPGDPPLLTKEQAEALQRTELERRESRDAQGNPSPLPVGGDASAPKSIELSDLSGSSCPVKNVTCEFAARCVTGLPA